MANTPKEKQFSRRDFLKTTGVATGGIIGGSLLGGLVGFNLDGSSSGKTRQLQKIRLQKKLQQEVRQAD